MAYQKILIPVDLSEKNELALKTVEYFGMANVEITLLHVIEMIQNITFEEIEDFYKKLHGKAEKILEQWSKELREKGFQVHMSVLYGKRGQEIVQYAAKEKMDLIVMRSHCVDRASSSESFGTLSHQVALFSNCSVFLVR